MQNHDPIIIALDFDSPGEARSLIRLLGDQAGFYKVGLELFTAAGPDFVRELVASGKRVFLDLKFFDIGETVKRATEQVSRLGASFLTIHGSPQVMRAAHAGRESSLLKLLAVTVLTSFDQDDLADLGYPSSIADLVDLRVRNARASGINGIVCSPLEVKRVRSLAGPDMKLVIPGVRSAGADKGDQKRVATPAEAIQDGADYLVIGRQVTRSTDPRSACEQILSEIAAPVSAR